MSQENKYKWYQFTVQTRIVNGGASTDVQVNLICRLELEKRIDGPFIQGLLNDGAARAVKAVGGTENTHVFGSAIIHSMYLGIMTDSEMNPPQPKAEEPVADVAQSMSEHSDAN